MSLINKELADFKVTVYQNKDGVKGKGEFRDLTKSDLLGKWSVLFFYPADFTFVCPTELEDLENQYENFKKIGCEIYSVSCDTHFVHKAWHESSEKVGKISYPMIGDPTGALARDVDAYIEEAGMAERGTYIINPEGKIAAYEVSAGNKVQALQFVAEHGDEVCPAKWQPGKETLKPSFDLVGLI